MTDFNRASVLSEALPHIQNYKNKTIVVKYGGAAMKDPALQEIVAKDIVLLSSVGMRVVVVHGGGPEINTMLRRVGIEPKKVDGLRVTDAETMDITKMVLCGKISKEIVCRLQEQGGEAISLSGLDGGLFSAEKIKSEFDYGYVGEVTKINPGPINTLLDAGYIPVISTIAIGTDKKTNYNINADTAAAELAAAIGAEKLILLTDVPGLLEDENDTQSVIRRLKLSQIPELIKNGTPSGGKIGGGMLPKLECCTMALRRGVPKAHILDGREPHSILVEILTDGGIGTMLTNG